MQTFYIDGPGGEIIQSVEVSVWRTKREDAYSFERHGKPESFKIGHTSLSFFRPWKHLTIIIFYVLANISPGIAEDLSISNLLLC